ncbi:hypothetical protein RF11_04090 [Thelohanellus kitauei]|uniref:Uncharacterized protein n=1 Tax=Thelohanellus kitauei TaxID=669202 RepID=A0A0C2MK13_THEKT|nr:hypothetical protein RF11_04090 [Thelohanellus kitauei]
MHPYRIKILINKRNFAIFRDPRFLLILRTNLNNTLLKIHKLQNYRGRRVASTYHDERSRFKICVKAGETSLFQAENLYSVILVYKCTFSLVERHDIMQSR